MEVRKPNGCCSTRWLQYDMHLQCLRDDFSSAAEDRRNLLEDQRWMRFTIHAWNDTEWSWYTSQLESHLSFHIQPYGQNLSAGLICWISLLWFEHQLHIITFDREYIIQLGNTLSSFCQPFCSIGTQTSGNTLSWSLSGSPRYMDRRFMCCNEEVEGVVWWEDNCRCLLADIFFTLAMKCWSSNTITANNGNTTLVAPKSNINISLCCVVQRMFQIPRLELLDVLYINQYKQEHNMDIMLTIILFYLRTSKFETLCS